MGKGDKRTKRGKISKGTYGVLKPRHANPKVKHTTKKRLRKNNE